MLSKDEKLSDLKSVLRSLLIAKGNREVTVYALNKDYLEVEGTDIPYKEFGYSSLIDFLKSIYDTVRIYLNASHSHCIKHVETEKSAHISSLIARQKKPPKKKSSSYKSYSCYKPRWNQTHSKPSYPYRSQPRTQNFHSTLTNYSNQNFQRSNETYRTVTQQVISNEIQSNSKTSQQITTKEMPAASNKSSNDHTQDYHPDATLVKDVLKEMKLLPDRFPNNLGLKKTDVLSRLKQKINKSINYTIHDLNNHLNVYSKYLIIENDLIFFKDEMLKKQENEKFYSSMAKKTQETSSNLDNDVIINDRTKFRLQKLMEKHPEGIWCSELPTLYKSEYKLDLEYFELGYTNITEFVVALPDIFRITQPENTSRQMVVDARSPNKIPDIQHKTLASIYNYNDFIAKEPEPVPIKLTSDVSTSLIPEFVMKLNESVEQIDASILVKDCKTDYIEVNISEIFTPSFFWITLRQNKRMIREMMNQLGDFYSNLDLDEYRVPQIVAAVGLNVACLYNKMWHRAIIKKVKPDGFVVVWFYDYGTVKTYNPNNLFFLHKKFSTLPAQAIPAGLHNIKPIDSTKWPRESTNKFINKVWNVPLIAMICSVDEENNSVMISLTDTSDDEIDVHISDWMVDNKQAEFGKLMSKVPLHTLCKYDELMLMNIHEDDNLDSIVKSKSKKHNLPKNDNDFNELNVDETTENNSRTLNHSPVLRDESFETSQLVTLVKESMDLSRRTNTITQAILLNMPNDKFNTIENCYLEENESINTKSEIKVPSKDDLEKKLSDESEKPLQMDFLKNKVIKVSEMSCDFEQKNNSEKKQCEIKKINGLLESKVDVSTNQSNDHLFKECKDTRLSLKSFYEKSLCKLAFKNESDSKYEVKENSNNNKQQNETVTYDSDDGSIFYRVEIVSEEPENNNNNYYKNNNSPLNTKEDKLKDKNSDFNLKAEFDEGSFTKPNYSQTNSTLSSSLQSSMEPVPSKQLTLPSYMTMTLSNRCENKVVHIIHLDNQGWMCGFEFVDAFTDYKDERILFKLLELLKHDVDYKHVSRETEPQLFNQLDNELELTWEKDRIEPFVFTLVPLKAVLEILVKLDYLEEKIIREAIPVVKQKKNDAEDILYEQYKNKILFDVLKLIFKYKSFRTSVLLE